MAEYIQGINPIIIKWARERSGYTLQEVAKSFNRDVATIDIIRGNVQLKNLRII